MTKASCSYKLQLAFYILLISAQSKQPITVGSITAAKTQRQEPVSFRMVRQVVLQGQ